jgi:hypothetical protein
MPFDAFDTIPDGPISSDLEALRAARNLIGRGWAKHCYSRRGRSGHYHYCAVAAVALACGDASLGKRWMNPNTRRLVRELARDLPQTGSKVVWRIQGPKGRVIMFNDRRTTSFVHILTAFNRTIDRLERQHQHETIFAMA